jgi:hypothetical protein
MWQWDDDLRLLGFRRRGERYWQCERGYGLGQAEHVSIFSWGEQAIPGRRGPARFLVEVTEFHVTFLLGGEHLHFYYHEYGDHEWRAAGHTSANEIRRVGAEVAVLRAHADAVAEEVIAGLGGRLRPRRCRSTEDP